MGTRRCTSPPHFELFSSVIGRETNRRTSSYPAISKREEKENAHTPFVHLSKKKKGGERAASLPARTRKVEKKKGGVARAPSVAPHLRLEREGGVTVSTSSSLPFPFFSLERREGVGSAFSSADVGERATCQRKGKGKKGREDEGWGVFHWGLSLW